MDDGRARDPQEDAESVPFAGFRRNAPALFGGIVVLLVLWFLPSPTVALEDAPQIDLVQGRIVALTPNSDDPTLPDVTVVILSGPRAGETDQGYLEGPAGQLALPDYKVGDEVIVSITDQPDDQFIAVSDRWRIPALGLVLGVFAVAVTIVGGWKGVRSLLALALTLGAVIKIVLPLILLGWDPVLVAVFVASGVTLITLVLTEGLKRSTFAAAAGTLAALALTAVLAVVFTAVAQFTEAQGSGDVLYLQSVLGPNFDLGGLLLAAVILGALGVLDDVTVTQAAAVSEINEADPRVTRRGLFARAMNVGRSHISATVNTLVLAYVGASLPLLVLFAASAQDPVAIASGEVVAVEIVRALVGSIGIVAAVPLTTAIAVVLVGRHLPFIGDGSGSHRAAGWE